ncbi:hypothetical protein ANCCAN_00133 [Ancylostoma caninum]|uniref:Uncharacterized protein n=1 Tax=Ancylostoma caninum TaxID=29170 RepID=A0A368HDC6_ANCCA|nr:hypothetical protein ANCCAN_00133 [Ancylostoma caninum]
MSKYPLRRPEENLAETREQTIHCKSLTQDEYPQPLNVIPPSLLNRAVWTSNKPGSQQWRELAAEQYGGTDKSLWHSQCPPFVGRKKQLICCALLFNN